MEDTYLTLSRISEGLFKEKGSKFLAFAYPINEEEDVKKIVDKLKNIIMTQDITAMPTF